VSAAAREGHKLFIAGSGSAVARHADARILDVRGSKHVIEYVPGDLTITIGAGMTLAELAAVTAPNNQWCPLLSWGSDRATIGGVLATARRGPASATLGAPRDLALGMTFVDGRACVVSSGGRVVKNVAGFDLTRALIGSWGTLGCIVSASLRLRALPPAQETWVVPLGAASRDAIAAFARGPYSPVACERIPADLSRELGFSHEPHVVMWLAGSTVHVAAARSALQTVAPVRDASMSVWDVIRSHGPFTGREEPRRMGDALARLNARVRDVFDPHAIFVSPVMALEHEVVHV
jgi:FAD/FMN-containing dehydrogenase